MNLLYKFLFIFSLLQSIYSLECQKGKEYTNSRRRRRGSGYCIKCKKGRYNNDINSQCNSCPGGKYNNNIGATSCIGTSVCPSGKFAPKNPTSVEDTMCTNCLPGQYQNNTGTNNCDSCPGGQYQPHEGTSTCLGSLICPAGKFGKENAILPNVCQTCSPNTYSSINGSIVCIQCSKQEYQLYPGQTSCLKKDKCSGYKYFDTNIQKCKSTHEYILVEAILCWVSFALSFVLFFVACCICSNQKKSVGYLLIISIFSIIASLICFANAFKNKISDTTFDIYISIHIIQIIVASWFYSCFYSSIDA